MTDSHEIKYQEMQKYVPFIQRVIEKLKVNNEQQADNPRRTQLQKMEMLYDLLTNKHKKIKMETLMKCEGVLIKLQAKIEKNEDSILHDVKLKQQASAKATSTTVINNTKAAETEDLLGPASPPPEVIPDDVDQPVVIPTERRCSPVLEIKKCTAGKSQHHKDISEQRRLQDSQHSTKIDFESLRKKVFHYDSKHNLSQDKQNPTQDKNTSLYQRSQFDSHKSGHKDRRQTKETHHSKHLNPNRTGSLLSNSTNVEGIKSPCSEQKLQVVKVVITEPLPAHIKKQHFPSSSKYLQKSSKSHSDFNEAYSPEELWEKYSESHNKRPSATAPVFSRLGAKVPENVSASASKPTGRYTPIPDVLKSPPLSVSDINNLLLESGGDKILNDISEIGSRRPVKNEDNQRGSPNNSFEVVRKKLAQTAKINSLHSEAPKLQVEKDVRKSSPLPHERIALKYNPHPRQERLQSVSSTDGSECSTQSMKMNDPRIKLKLQTSGLLQQSPTHVAPLNVNVLPAINLSDPRLKKQNTAALPSEKQPMPSTPPTFTSSPNVSFLKHSPLSYSCRKDPRISRISNNTSSVQSTPTRRLSTNQLQFSSEEKWDSDEEDKIRPAIKNDPRLARRDQHRTESRYESSTESRDGSSLERSYSDSRNGKNIYQQRFHLPSGEDAFSLIGPDKDAHNLRNQNVHKDTSIDISKPCANKLKSSTTFVIPNPPKSDTEEDWDSDNEIKIVKPKPLTTDTALSPVNKSPVVPSIAPYHTQITPKAIVNPTRISTAPMPPVHMTHIPHPQSKYPAVGPNNHHQTLMQSSVANNRFNSVLNDKSERIKYYEAKKQKTIEPRTYKEFREAKERAQAQEAAIKRAAETAESKNRVHEPKDINKDKETNDKKDQQMDTFKKVEDDNVEKKILNNDIKKPFTPETTLDKMYRTQNFNSKFPKANSSFKIPKKKPEETPREEVTKANEVVAEQIIKLSNDKLIEKIKPNQDEPSITNTILSNQEIDDKDINKPLSTSEITLKQNEPFTYNQSKTDTSDKPEEKGEQPQPQNNDSIKEKVSMHKQKPTNDKTNDKSDSQKIVENILTETSSNKQTEEENIEKERESKEKIEEQSSENNVRNSGNDNKINTRDPRCKAKTTTVTTDSMNEREPCKDNFKMFGDIVITSSKNEVILKPQDNLDKFNKLTEELTAKPQRVLRRRNTMVVFDSAPLVDKEKLKKANALLFEDIQEEEKRKRKQAEEDRLNARRNRNLEEMFKKTDDNCTVSTQNIITGKRRTRASINFNETVNAKNIFKQKTAPVTPAKQTKSNAKAKLKNVQATSEVKDDESDDDDEVLSELARKAKINNSLKGVRTKSAKGTKLKDGKKTEESDTESKANIKLTKKRAQVNKKSSTNNADQDIQTVTVTDNVEVKFKPIQNDEHQNCAVSSTSADIGIVEDTTSSLISTNRSLKTESDDNEPTSTGSKSNNPTPTPEQHVLNEIVDRILKPDADRNHILGLLGQILSEERLELIKSLIENTNTQNEHKQINEEDMSKQNVEEKKNDTISVVKTKTSTKNKDRNKYDDYEGEEQEDRKPLKAGGEKKIPNVKKKRNELDRLNEDIRDMFICEGVLTATGRRMCTIMGKDVDLAGSKKSAKDSTPVQISEQRPTNTRKQETLKPPASTRSLRRSIRCKPAEYNDDDETQSIISHTTEESIEDLNTTDMDATPQRKMPILKPHTPIKIPDEVVSKTLKTKEVVSKRKSDSKLAVKAKKSKNDKEDPESEEKESKTETDNVKEEPTSNKGAVVKNTNIHWHNQSKHTTWCMVCEKRIPAITSSLHYKTCHRENYISRMAPVLLQQFKQGKLNQPLFGVKKAQKQPSWFFRCPFCLKYFNTPMPLWLEHFQNHTVEYRYECSKCHRCSNRKITVSRHLKNCEGATIITSTVKLNVPTVINAHVCHLCNFIQLKRVNLERHYIEQHELEGKTVDLLGYVIKLFDVENVQCVTEEKAVEREKEFWKSIEKNEQIIDIDDDEESNTSATAKSLEKEKEIEGESVETITKERETSNEKEKETAEKNSENEIELSNFENRQRLKLQQEEHVNAAPIDNEKVEESIVRHPVRDEETEKDEPTINKAIKSQNESITPKEDIKNVITEPKKCIIDKTHKSVLTSNDFEVVVGKATVQDLQEELLALAAEAAGKEAENQEYQEVAENIADPRISLSKEGENETTKVATNQQVADETPERTNDEHFSSESQTTMSDIISSSIDMFYNRDCSSTNNKRKSIGTDPTEAKKVCLTTSNVFMPTRDENNYSPTVQILAQSIINIEGDEIVKDKPITMADRLSQRLKKLQAENVSTEKPNIVNQSKLRSTDKVSKENAFEKLINDTLFELTKVKDNANNSSVNQSPVEIPAIEQTSESAFDKIYRENILEIETDNENVSQITQHVEIANTSKDVPRTTVITVISDDEDWEDIEITETAPTSSTISTSNIQKSKNKGLFPKFGMFKANNSKSKKHLPPMVYLNKKKTKEKSLQSTSLAPSPFTATKVNDITNNSSSNSTAHLGFKPVINIMDGLFPDSPSNDPIDLVPELAPLEPLQDLNDISSILESNLSAVNINAADNHTSIEDALDFISEQQANDKQISNNLALKLAMPSQTKATTINNISHVGFSVQTAEENTFKFYCLLQNCSFLYSSDSIGLETHFMCEHSEIKWDGYCLMCQSQCFPNADASIEHAISKEIRHMMEKHANKSALDLNTDSTQHSTTSSHDNEERPKIKIRRLTGDCLSRATPENVPSSKELLQSGTTPNVTPISMLGALLVADPKPPTKEMPPQPQMPLTEPLLIDNRSEVPANAAFRNVNSDFLITSVTSSVPQPNPTPIQILNVVSLSDKILPMTELEQIQMPKITNVRTLAPKAASSSCSQQIEKDHNELVDAAEESLEVSQILENAGKPSTNQEASRSANDSPVVVAETMPLAQSKTGDFVVTQTVSAQYNEFSSTAVGFNISIAASTTGDKTTTEATSTGLTSTSTPASIASRQYKCMGTGCKFVSRVPVAMSDHLRFHERRNFSSKRDYFSCGFCLYNASDVEDYMKHANQFHIINKGGTHSAASSEIDTATSLTQKIQNILNSSNSSNGRSRNSAQRQQQSQAKQVQDSQEVYLKKLRDTIDEIVGPTGLTDDKLYRCVIKNCSSQLAEGTFLSHIMFHIATNGGNPNNYIFKCPHCTAQYHRAAGIKAHIKNHARNRFFCYLCDETSTNPGQILKHFSEKHWHTLNMFTKELLKPKISGDGSEMVLDSSYYVAYTQDLSVDEVRKFGEKLILEWQRKKYGSKTHFKSTEIDLLPMSAIFKREVNCGECEYKTKVRTNMFRHLLMHKQNPGLLNKSGADKVCSVDPVNPVPCLNSSERFFDKMTNLASSSLIPSSSGSSTTKSSYKIPYGFVEENKRYTCGCQGCNYIATSEDLFRTHFSAVHNTAMTYSCTFCQEEICKRGISIDRIMNHTRFHGATIYRCEECNYVHHLRYVVERHINERHATMKLNIITHNRSSEESAEGTTTTTMPFAGKKYKETAEINQTAQTSNASTGLTNSDSSGPKPIATYVNTAKGKGKWLCDVCGHRTTTVGQMQTHCQQQHGVKNQYKCAHCNFGSQQLSQILHHIDEKHSGKTREARYVYHKVVNNSEEVADTRPLWQRNDPTRVRHIRGILMENEEESEEYRKKLALSEDVDDDSGEDMRIDMEENDEELNDNTSYVTGYEFGCYHCSFKTQTFEDLKNQHYRESHNSELETAKPFWYRLHRRLCCPDCRTFTGNYIELQQHLQNTHKKNRFYGADIRMAENDDTSQRILCGYCSFHCANVEHLYKHHLRAHHWPQDIRIDNNEQIMEILALGKPEVSYQCTLCADIFPNRVAIVQHACNIHAGEDSFSFRELTNSLIYRCNSCCFTSTTETELLRHTLEHYARFKVCQFCRAPQSCFNVYMQHCYAEHKNEIQKFRTYYPLTEIRRFLLQTLIVFPSGLVLNKRNLLNTKYGKTDVIEEIYEDIYKISQQPPIPRLSIARLVARKSIEAQQKHVDSSLQDEIINAMQSYPRSISKRRLTVACSLEDYHDNNKNPIIKPKFTIVEAKPLSTIVNRRTTLDNDQQHQVQQPQKHNEFNVPQQHGKISKRRRTVAVDRETLFSSNLMSNCSNSLLTLSNANGKKRKTSYTHAHTPPPKQVKEKYPLNLDMEPFSFYGRTPEELDLSKMYTKVAIGGIKTPLTIDKFKLLFDIECQLKLTKCDEDSQLLTYNNYKHIKKACPASQKSKFNVLDEKDEL